MYYYYYFPPVITALNHHYQYPLLAGTPSTRVKFGVSSRIRCDYTVFFSVKNETSNDLIHAVAQVSSNVVTEPTRQ